MFTSPVDQKAILVVAGGMNINDHSMEDSVELFISGADKFIQGTLSTKSNAVFGCGVLHSFP